MLSGIELEKESLQARGKNSIPQINNIKEYAAVEY